MQRKELKPVSEAIISLDKDVNSLDPAKGIDSKICAAAAYKNTTGETEKDGYCGLGNSQNSSASKGGLSRLWLAGGSSEYGGGYDQNGAAAIGDKTSATISGDISKLNREQKGVVSSAFAKAHEGAEITT